MKLKHYIVALILLLSSQGISADGVSQKLQNPLRNVAMDLLARGGVSRRMKVPECVASNKLDGVVAQRIDASRTTLWVGEMSHDGVAAWSAGFYSLSRNRLEVELRFFNRSDSSISLPQWALEYGTNIAPNTVLSFSQQWLPVHTNSMPVATSVQPPEQSAKKLVKAAIGFRKMGDGAKASKSLRMALLAEPLDMWSVVERTFLEDDGDGAIDVFMKNRFDPAAHFESVCESYLEEKAFKEVEILLAQAQDFPVFDIAREKIRARLQSLVKDKEVSR